MIAGLEGPLRTLFEDDHEAFRDSVQGFLQRHAVPNLERWESDRIIDRGFWKQAGEAGFLGLGVPAEYGGGGTDDYRFRCVIIEELARINSGSLQSSLSLQDDVFIPYVLHLASEEQKQRWLPGACSGELIGGIAMTEPGTGSDLQGIQTTAVRDGDEWVIDGAKTFITSGINADVILVVARTDAGAGSRGFSLIAVERDTPGFTRGKQLRKIGLHAQDTAELFFDGCRVPLTNLIGEEGSGFQHLMGELPLERLSLGVSSIAHARAALRWTQEYVGQRQAFGAPLAKLQTVQFTLAEMITEIDVSQAFVDQAVLAFNAGKLDAVEAAKTKWWGTELQKRVVDRCVQLHGGYGYMEEYPIARSYLDTRVQTIYGGTTEIMKLIIGRQAAGV